MKTFKVQEQFLITCWTYITAETEKEAIHKLEHAYGTSDLDDPIDELHKDTLWSTLEEV